MNFVEDKRHVYALRELGYRVFDIIFACLVLVVFSPLFLVLSILIKISSEGPVLYRQERIGKHGKYFLMYKFRTMVHNADDHLHGLLSTNEELRSEYEKLHKLKVDPRVTSVGRFLRETSLDELSQFFNVLFGEMSVVGPRPIVDLETQKYGEHLDEFLSVRPGITGLWQIWGRNDTTYEERVFLDISYIRNRSFHLNLYIMISTIFTMISRKGAY